MPGQKDKPSFLDEALPEPLNPQARRRALSTSLLLCFFLVICWLAAFWSKDPVQIFKVRATWMYKDSGRAGMAGEGGFERKLLDFGRYHWWHRDLRWDQQGRLIIVGDVHGQHEEVKRLLEAINHSTDQDTLVFAGDLVAKHPKVAASLDTLDLVRSLNASSVRGNHDQYVLFWRAWMEANRRTLDADLDNSTLLTLHEASLDSDFEASDDAASKLLPHPDSWKKHRLHFKIARALSPAQYEQLSALPLSLYIEPLHAFVVHAGLLPLSEPRSGYARPAKSLEPPDPTEDALRDAEASAAAEALVLPEQLESRNPAFFTPSNKVFAALRRSPTKSMLLVEQNRDPYTLLEMRGVSKHGNPHSKDKGQNWWEVYNKAARKCARKGRRRRRKAGKRQELVDADDGEELAHGGVQWEHIVQAGQDAAARPQDQLQEEEEETAQEEEPDREAADAMGDDATDEAEEVEAGSKDCAPVNVIYGHWKAQGLNVQEYTFGLDSGCVYGDQLSALIVGQEPLVFEDRADIHVRDVTIDGRAAQIVSLDCTAPSGGPV